MQATMSSPADQTIIIRDIRGAAEMRAVEELQKEVWECSDRDVVPLLTLIPAVEVGGILVGAFAGDVMIGFAFGFVGQERGRVIIHSDMLAVKPAFRGANLGYILKLAQRERALARGISQMTWTFDPLRSRNAHLNFHKLGAVADRYLINYYGEESSSALHQNIGTDRLWVHWPLASERVARRLTGKTSEGPPAVFGEARRLIKVNENNAPRLNDASDNWTQPYVVIEIPDDVGAIQHDAVMMVRWRDAMRAAFGAALAAGYLVEEFYRVAEGGVSRGAYLLRRGGRVDDFARA